MSTSLAILPREAALRRAVVRLLIVVSVLMLLAGVPNIARSSSPGALSEQELRHQAFELREAVALFRAQHDGRLPDAERWDDVLHELSAATDLAGRPGGALGPYLSPAWVTDPISGPGSGRVVDQLPAAADGDDSWIYCRATGELRCDRAGLDAAGAPFWDF